MSTIDMAKARDWLESNNVDVVSAPAALLPADADTLTVDDPEARDVNATETECDEPSPEIGALHIDEKHTLQHATQGNLRLRTSANSGVPDMNSVRDWLNNGQLLEPTQSAAGPRDKLDTQSTTTLTADPSTAATSKESEPTLGNLVALLDGWKSGPAGVARQTDKGQVKQFLKDWGKIEEFFKAKALPCHSFTTEEYSPALRSATYFRNDTSNTHTTHISMLRTVETQMPSAKLPDSITFTKMGSAAGSKTTCSIVSVPSDAVAGHLAEGWALWHPPTPARKLTHWGYWCDAREPATEAKDMLHGDSPARDGMFYLGKGHELLSRWSDGRWQQGHLLGPRGGDPDVKKNSATYAEPENWRTVSDKRVATSTGHILAKWRPRGVAPGWGGYDQFTDWQASGRKIQPWMVSKTATAVTDPKAAMPFVTETEEAEPVVVNNAIVSTKNREDKRAPLSLYEVFSGGRAGGRRRD